MVIRTKTKGKLSTKYYTENTSSNTNTTENPGENSGAPEHCAVSIHMSHQSCYYCYKPGDKWWMREFTELWSRQAEHIRWPLLHRNFITIIKVILFTFLWVTEESIQLFWKSFKLEIRLRLLASNWCFSVFVISVHFRVHWNIICGVICSMLVTSALNCGFESGLIKPKTINVVFVAFRKVRNIYEYEHRMVRSESE